MMTAQLPVVGVSDVRSSIEPVPDFYPIGARSPEPVYTFRMGALTMVLGVVIFVVATVLPVMWCWGHAVAVIVGVIGLSMMVSEQNARLLERAIRNDPRPKPSVMPLFLLILFVIGLLLLTYLFIDPTRGLSLDAPGASP